MTSPSAAGVAGLFTRTQAHANPSSTPELRSQGRHHRELATPNPREIAPRADRAGRPPLHQHRRPVYNGCPLLGRGGGTGRREGLKNLCPCGREGSSPSLGISCGGRLGAHAHCRRPKDNGFGSRLWPGSFLDAGDPLRPDGSDATLLGRPAEPSRGWTTPSASSRDRRRSGSASARRKLRNSGGDLDQPRTPRDGGRWSRASQRKKGGLTKLNRNMSQSRWQVPTSLVWNTTVLFRHSQQWVAPIR